MSNEYPRDEQERTAAGDLAAWLTGEVERRGWSLRELGRRSGLSGAVISDVARGQQRPGLRFCVQIAGALGLPPEGVLRRAGLLPPLPPAVEEEQEAVVMLRQLTPESRGTVMVQLRAMTASLPPDAGVPDTGTQDAGVPDRAAAMEADAASADAAASVDAELEEQLLEEFRHLPEEWQAAAIQEIERLQRFSQIRPRIIGDEDETDADAV